MPNRHPTDDLRSPHAALLHPLWIVALIVLAVNDQWFKATELMPAVAGKLSDFAGLLVAPFLMATLIRARQMRTIIACHVAVGLAFTALQLSPAFAQLWSNGMALTGFDWVTRPDPIDLMALPMLWLSIRVFGRASLAQPRHPVLQTVVAGVGLLCCMGTSGLYPRCENDSHCAEKGEYCLRGRCNECRDDSHCQGDRVCQRGKCGFPVGYCNPARRCPNGYTCVAKACVEDPGVECDASHPCQAGSTCMAQTCMKVGAEPDSRSKMWSSEP